MGAQVQPCPLLRNSAEDLRSGLTMEHHFAARDRAGMRFEGFPGPYASSGSSSMPVGSMLPGYSESDIAMELAERALLESYCAELERVLAASTDELVFYEKAAALDQRCLENLFAQRFGAASADPLQALRQPPVAGIVHPAVLPSVSTSSSPLAGPGTSLGVAVLR